MKDKNKQLYRAVKFESDIPENERGQNGNPYFKQYFHFSNDDEFQTQISNLEGLWFDDEQLNKTTQSHLQKTIHSGSFYDYDPKDVINILTSLKNNTKYLEIGVDQGATFDNIHNVSIKHGADPYGASRNITHKMTSQMFFVMNNRFWNNKYDVVFIDGMHLIEFINDEIFESLKILNDDGFIVLHDTCPINEGAQMVIEEEYQEILDTVISVEEKDRLKWHENTKKHDPIGYNGDCWRLVPLLRKHYPNMTILSIPNACVTILSKKKIPKFEGPQSQLLSNGLTVSLEQFSNNPLELTWEHLWNYFELLMNPFTFKYFEENIYDYFPKEDETR
jgi:hypothetical protein